MVNRSAASYYLRVATDALAARQPLLESCQSSYILTFATRKIATLETMPILSVDGAMEAGTIDRTYKQNLKLYSSSHTPERPVLVAQRHTSGAGRGG